MQYPPLLKPQDKVAIIAPAGRLNKEAVLENKKQLENWGLQVQMGKYCFKDHYKFSAPDAQRLKDLQSVLDDPSIKAVFAARGGYGITRFMDQINWKTFINKPKWLIGFSDITALLFHLQTKGIASIHGPMIQSLDKVEKRSLRAFRSTLFEGKGTLQGSHRFNKAGEIAGRLLGGNLTLINHLICTDSFPKLDKDPIILFIEEVGEALYQIDRLMIQLKRAGILSKIKGLVVGQFSELKEDKVIFGMDAYEIIQEKMQEYDIPIAFNMPIGHDRKNEALVIGAPAKLSIEQNKAILDWEIEH